MQTFIGSDAVNGGLPKVLLLVRFLARIPAGTSGLDDLMRLADSIGYDYFLDKSNKILILMSLW